jgi:hypothetical protein
MSTLRLKPAEGRRVRLHDGRLMPAEGWEVEDDAIWRRRLRDGDVVVVTTAPSPASVKESKA